MGREEDEAEVGSSRQTGLLGPEASGLRAKSAPSLRRREDTRIAPNLVHVMLLLRKGRSDVQVRQRSRQDSDRTMWRRRSSRDDSRTAIEHDSPRSTSLSYRYAFDCHGYRYPVQPEPARHAYHPRHAKLRPSARRPHHSRHPEQACSCGQSAVHQAPESKPPAQERPQA